MELQSWDSYSHTIINLYINQWRTQVNVACPNCGAPLLRRNDIILTTHPAQYQYECDKCGWIGYAFK